MNDLKNFDYWHRLVSYTFFYILAGTLMMALFQLAIIIEYGNFNFIAEASNIIKSITTGAQGSGKMFAVFIAPFFLLGLVCWLLPWKLPIQLLSRFLSYIGLIILTLSFIISFVNFFYYQPYQRNIDHFIFEAQNENFGDLYQYLKGEFPLTLLVFFLLLGIVLLFYLHKLLIHWSHHKLYLRKWYSKTIYTIAVFCLFVIFARGSLRPSIVYSFIEDAEITNNNLLNYSATNGVVALYVAYEENKDLSTLTKIDLTEAIASFQLLYPDVAVSSENLKEKLYKKTSNLTDQPKPHLVFVLMESWSTQLLKFHNKDNLNFLGSLEAHLKEDYFFKNFLSMTQGTHTSMQFLLTNYSGIDLTHSKYDKIILDSSIPKFLEKQGYQTIFVTSGRKDWHRMGDLLTSLGFDEILGWNDFKEIYPDADSNFYGGYEETVYDYILKRLQTQKKDKPLFIFFLTTNNHIPYHMPSHYKPYPLEKVPQEMQKILSDEERVRKTYKTYQYTSETLGQFVSAIKKDTSLKNKVVIAGTGDHFTRGLFSYTASESDIFGNFSVPFYLYLPLAYRKNVTYDKERIGSHRDVFPTIFENIFSNVKYFASGNNLLAKNQSQALAINHNFLITKQGAVLLGVNPVYYKWQDQVGGKLVRNMVICS